MARPADCGLSLPFQEHKNHILVRQSNLPGLCLCQSRTGPGSTSSGKEESCATLQHLRVGLAGFPLSSEPLSVATVPHWRLQDTAAPVPRPHGVVTAWSAAYLPHAPHRGLLLPRLTSTSSVSAFLLSFHT